jgi:epoxyqueuosine reductase
MDAIIPRITEEMKKQHYKFSTVSIIHLPEVQDAVGKLVRQGMISEQFYRKWHFYLDTSIGLPEAQTIIIVAMPQSITRMWFKWQGTDYPADIPPTYFSQLDDSHAENVLKTVLGVSGCKIARARLPLKTLAVRSGLAKYGRNNISYISGMGSFYRLIAFYTDYPCEEDRWQEVTIMKGCEKCSLCRENCPTGCISNDRFFIHPENCLTYHNEAESDFPQWIRPDWHNALIGCMRCQLVCPVNKPHLHKLATGPTFSEEETEQILKGTPVEKLGSETRQKLDRMVYDEIYSVMARNLRTLIDNQKKVI